MPFSLACGDLMPGCPVRFEADDEEVLLSQVARHAAEDHGLRHLSPELRAQVRAAIAS